MWPGSGFSGFTLFGLFKNKPLLERDREKRSIRAHTFLQIILKKKAIIFVFYEKSQKRAMMGKSFFLELWCMR